MTAINENIYQCWIGERKVHLLKPACLTLGIFTVTAPWRLQGTNRTVSYLHYVDEVVAVRLASSEVNTVAQIATGAKVIAAISELKRHKSDGKKTTWPYIYISSLCKGSPASENRENGKKKKKHFEGTGGLLKH